MLFDLIKPFLCCQAKAAFPHELASRYKQTAWAPLGMPALSKAAGKVWQGPSGKPFQKSSFHLPPSHLFPLPMLNTPDLGALSPSSLCFPVPSYPQLLHSLLMCRSKAKPAWEGKLQSRTHWLVDCYFPVVDRKILKLLCCFYLFFSLKNGF